MAPSGAVDSTQSRPASSIGSDPTLQPFLAAKFDPIDHLNATLPSLTLVPNTSYATRQPQTSSLSEISTTTQSILSQLSAQTSRLSELLTQLTDEILRSGARLTYEVEVLRGDTSGLTEALTDWLWDDISKLVPSASSVVSGLPHEEEGDGRSSRLRSLSMRAAIDPKDQTSQTAESETTIDPPYITQLRTLTLVRSRLESVINTFGEAMQWTLSPSESSAATSFISVSSPESSSDIQGREQKGKQVAKKLRDEISDALASNGNGPSGVKAAKKRIEELRDLTIVWKGTAEEKARTKFVDGLAIMFEDRAKALEREAWERRQRDGRDRSSSARPRTVSPSKQARPSGEYDRNGKSTGEGGPGFFRNLQRLRDEIYLE